MRVHENMTESRPIRIELSRDKRLERSIMVAKVRVFSQPTCPACNDLKDYLKKRGVEFEDMDITASKDAFNELTKVHKVRVTPLLVMGDKKLIGFDPAEVDKLLAENK